MNYTQPDIDFIRYLKHDCGSTLSTCMQCGSCTAVCNISPAKNPFPRKEMIWACWGLKDRLIGNHDIWLCHQCGDCSSSCPRDVRPADVMSSIRKYCYLHFSRPFFLGKLLHNPAYLPVIILFPVIIIALILGLAGTLEIPEGPVDYSQFFPHALLNLSFSIITLVFYISFISGLRSFWKNLSTNNSSADRSKFISSAFIVIKEILFHRNFRSCKENRYRHIAHLLSFYGFILLLLVTLFAILATIFFDYPMPLLHPVKIAGNIAGIAMITGCVIMIWKRLFPGNMKIQSNYFDWFFLTSILLLVISGFIVEFARFENWSIAYHIYFIHLVLVWMVIMYLPYTKFAHIIFRTLALIFAKMTGRELSY